MMNKAIVGGLLVAVMGGVPGATYFLTQKEETSAVENDHTSAKAPITTDVQVEQKAPCTTEDSRNSCPDGEANPSQ